MKYLYLILVFFFSLSNLHGQNNTGEKKQLFKLPKGVTSNDYAPNTIVVKFRSIGSNKKISLSSPEVQAIKLKTASIRQVRQLFPSSPYRSNNLSSSLDDQYGLNRVIEIKYFSTVGIEKIINEILQNQNVEYAEPRYIYHQRNYTYATKVVNADWKSYVNYFSYSPNDPDLNKQYYLKQIHAVEAWDIPIKPTTPIIIAIIDSGSQLDHEDLMDNIDNSNSWNYVGTWDPITGLPIGNSNPTSTVNHGVLVSGLVSAVTNNAKGISSVANNYAKLLIIKAGESGNTIAYGYEGIKYAVDHGAKIINCSWGDKFYQQGGQDIINYALKKGCLVVAAAGNDGMNVVDYPAAYDGVLAVAGVTASDQKMNMSDYGPQVGISAPGENIYSTKLNGYGYDSGTSFATPIVCSAAALVKARFPAWSMQQVGERLKTTADNIDSKNSGYKGLLGTGRLNVYRALTDRLPDGTLPSPITSTIIPTPILFSFKLKAAYPNPAKDYTDIHFSIPNDGQTFLGIYSLSGKLVKEVLNKYLLKGKHYTRLLLNDVEAGVYIYKLQHGGNKHSLKLIVSK